MLRTRLQCGDLIPVHSKLVFFPTNYSCTNSHFNVPIFYQTLGAPQSNTERRACGLDCKAAADMRKDQTATTEDTFNVNTCGYRSEVSVPEINTRRQELTRNR